MAEERGGFPESMFGLRDRDRLTSVEAKLEFLTERADEHRDTLNEVRDMGRDTAQQVKTLVAGFALVGELEKRIAVLEHERGFIKKVTAALWALVITAAGTVAMYWASLHPGK